jgi:hypothetical protein
MSMTQRTPKRRRGFYQYISQDSPTVSAVLEQVGRNRVYEVLMLFWQREKAWLPCGRVMSSFGLPLQVRNSGQQTASAMAGGNHHFPILQFWEEIPLPSGRRSNTTAGSDDRAPALKVFDKDEMIHALAEERPLGIQFAG